ncbi:site-specific integrase [Fodinibius sp.]|uniref:site-specific integrase n=1 Tax=Fodinibius sp. TaxID=1872440 RepID=UPI002ACEA9BD|nr:site-specific integrase [Fodinibius sp.]MDZ7660204.1 site-specific integrase [Fodinibius sp.]
MGKSVLLSKIRTEIRRRGMSYRTEQTYIGWITRFIYYHNLEHPKNMGEKEVVEFLNHLVTNRGAPDSIQNQARQAIQFLYRHIIEKPLPSLTGIIQGETPYICRARNSNRKQQISAP